MLAMWVVMMIGMMTPSVAPMVLLYAAIARQERATTRRRRSRPPAGSSRAIYWPGAAFALRATLLQWLLEWRAWSLPMMAGTSRALGGLVLIAAGIYQWLPVKQACLSSCRAPLSFVQRHGGFQPTARGSLRLGVLHGLVLHRLLLGADGCCCSPSAS